MAYLDKQSQMYENSLKTENKQADYYLLQFSKSK